MISKEKAAGMLDTSATADTKQCPPIIAPAADSGKRLATLRARAALAGVVLHAIEGDDGRPLYVLTRWHLTRELRTLDEVEAWLAQVTGGRA